MELHGRTDPTSRPAALIPLLGFGLATVAVLPWLPPGLRNDRVAIGCFVLAWGATFWLGRRRRTTLILDGGTVRCGRRSATSHPAALTSWAMPPAGQRIGTILEFGGLRVGVRGPVPHTPELPAGRRVDIVLRPADFARLQAALDLPSQRPSRTVIPLVPPRTMTTALTGLLPFGIAAAVALGLGGPAMAVAIQAGGGYGAIRVIGAATAALLFGGAVITLMRAGRAGAPVRLLEIGPDLVIDGLSVPVPAVRVDRAAGVLRGRYGSTRYPVLVLTLPGAAPFGIGLQDGRYLWPGPAVPETTPAYLVGPADWHRLLAALGRTATHSPGAW